MYRMLFLGIFHVMVVGLLGCGNNEQMKAVIAKLSEREKTVSEQAALITKLESRLLSKSAKELSTLPLSYVVSNGVDAQQLAQSLVRSTLPILFSVGEQRLRVGRVTLLGREGNQYVGFTTSCAVTLNHPWPERVSHSENVNQIVAIKTPGLQYDYYLTEESVIAEDKGVALSKVISITAQREDPIIVTIDAKDTWKEVAQVSEGDYVQVFADEDVEGKPQEWSVSPGWGKCGPEGYPNRRDYVVSDKHQAGCILIGQVLDGEGRYNTLKGYLRGGVDFYVRKSGRLTLMINDFQRQNNSGSMRVVLRINRGIGKTALKKIRETGDKIRVKTFARNDVALVYFPVDKGNYFGETHPKSIATLGIEEPTKTVQELLVKATDLFGHKFMLYCERCDEEICRVPEIEEKAYQRGYEAGFKQGKEEGVRIFVSSFMKPLIGLAATFLTGGLPISVGGGTVKILGKAITQLIGEILQGDSFAEYLRPSLQRLAPDFNEVLSVVGEVVSLAELGPRALSADDIMETRDGEVRLADGKTLTFAGLRFAEGEGNLGALNQMLKQSSKLLFVPQRKKGGKFAGHFFDGDKYVNQLAIAGGLAVVDKADRAFPLLRDLLRFEEQIRK